MPNRFATCAAYVSSRAIRGTYATLLLRMDEDMRFVASRMGHTTLARLIPFYARWTRRAPLEDNTVRTALEASGLSKMLEFCQKDSAGIQGIFATPLDHPLGHTH